MNRPARSLCAKCVAQISDPDPDVDVQIMRRGYETLIPLDVPADERWLFVQHISYDPSDVRGHAFLVNGFELPLLAVAPLNGTPLCARHLGAFASLAVADGAHR